MYYVSEKKNSGIIDNSLFWIVNVGYSFLPFKSFVCEVFSWLPAGAVYKATRFSGQRTTCPSCRFSELPGKVAPSFSTFAILTGRCPLVVMELTHVANPSKDNPVCLFPFRTNTIDPVTQRDQKKKKFVAILSCICNFSTHVKSLISSNHIFQV